MELRNQTRPADLIIDSFRRNEDSVVKETEIATLIEAMSTEDFIKLMVELLKEQRHVGAEGVSRYHASHDDADAKDQRWHDYGFTLK